MSESKTFEAAAKLENSLRLIAGMNAKNIEMLGQIKEVLLMCGNHSQAITICDAITEMASANVYMYSIIFSGIKIEKGGCI